MEMRGKRVLDVGCGPGRYATDLAQQGYQVVLCDLLCEMLRLARRRVAEAKVAEVIDGAAAAGADIDLTVTAKPTRAPGQGAAGGAIPYQVNAPYNAFFRQVFYRCFCRAKQ